jgi:hypothetical protein
MTEKSDVAYTEIRFESKGAAAQLPTLTITGIKSELINRPEKIQQLMDLLELPEGTDARIVYSAGDVVVR